MSSPVVIYLDQNKWIDLLRCDKGRESSAEIKQVLELLRIKVSAKKVLLPLSPAHYLETWNRRNWQSRHELAGLMRELSGFATLAAVQRVLCWEVENFLLSNFRSASCNCPIPDVPKLVLGRGVDHAFSSVTGRMRLVDRVATKDAVEGRKIQPPEPLIALIARVRETANESYEWWSLACFEDSLDYEGFETRSEYRLGSERVLREESFALRLKHDPYLLRRLSDYLIAEEIGFATDNINQIGFWHDSKIGQLKDAWMKEGPTFGRALIDSLPSRSCIVNIRKAKHDNPQWKWQQHDQTDMAQLAVSVPYCDVVVTERQWCHVIRATKLDRRFNTQALDRLVDLLPILETV